MIPFPKRATMMLVPAIAAAIAAIAAAQPSPPDTTRPATPDTMRSAAPDTTTTRSATPAPAEGVRPLGIPAAAPAPAADVPKWKKVPGTYAVFETGRGSFVVKLMPEVAPKTVANFVGLATGMKEWTDPRTRAKRKSRYFDGQIFHRVTDFMIQAGDPTGAGNGGPGYAFEDEFGIDVVFDRAGRVGMANNGPGTNGSQFFITRKPTPWLNHKHTIFGQVVQGQEVVSDIGSGRTDAHERPLAPVRIVKVQIEEVK